MPVILHPIDLCAENQVGGVETFIGDYIKYTQEPIKVIGARRLSERYVETKVDFVSVCTLHGRRRYIPDLLKFSCGLVLHRKKWADEEVQLHRLELVPIVRLLAPKSTITTFIHTDLSRNITSTSDSIWRFAPWLYLRVEPFFVRFSKRIFTFAGTDFERLRLMRRDIELLPASYNSETFFTDVPQSIRPNTILWVGRFESVKDPQLAIKTLSQLPHDSFDSALFIGSGSLENEMKDLVNQLGLENKVRFIGPLPQSKLVDYYKAAKVLLHTSQFEGGPRVLLEALACGLHIITTVQGDPECVANRDVHSHRVVDRDPTHMSKALLETLQIAHSADVDLSDRSIRLQVSEIDKKAKG